jgi:hypothetical protein
LEQCQRAALNHEHTVRGPRNGYDCARTPRLRAPRHKAEGPVFTGHIYGRGTLSSDRAYRNGTGANTGIDLPPEQLGSFTLLPKSGCPTHGRTRTVGFQSDSTRYYRG